MEGNISKEIEENIEGHAKYDSHSIWYMLKNWKLIMIVIGIIIICIIGYFVYTMFIAPKTTSSYMNIVGGQHFTMRKRSSCCGGLKKM